MQHQDNAQRINQNDNEKRKLPTINFLGFLQIQRPLSKTSSFILRRPQRFLAAICTLLAFNMHLSCIFQQEKAMAGAPNKRPAIAEFQ
jgi:hypothetical protein